MTITPLRYRDGQTAAVGDAALSPELVPCRVVDLLGEDPTVAVIENGATGGKLAVHDLSAHRLVARNSTDVMRDGVAMIIRRARAGAPDAQYALGFLHAEGVGVDQSYDKAAGWFLKSASQGDATAQSWLGWMHANGKGLPHDDRQATTWYAKAAAGRPCKGCR